MPDIEMEYPTDSCKRCGDVIFLVSTGRHFKWLTNPNKKNSWHCGNDPAFPTRSHDPERADS